MNPAIKSILKSEGLPSPPGVAAKLLELFSVPNVEVSEMAQIIGADPALSAKLMEYCNSPTFARARETTNIRQAIVLIGMKAVKILALSFSLVRTGNSNKESTFDYDQFWNHSLAIAASAQTIAEQLGGRGDDEFLMGLMLKSGQIGLAHTFPERYAELLIESQETDTPLTELEKREWDVDHLDISVGLLVHWNFPQLMVQAFKALAKPEDEVSEVELTHARVLKLAERSAGMLHQKKIHENQINEARELAQSWFNISTEEFPVIFDRATNSWTELAKVLSFDTSEAQPFEQLERRALKGIAELSMGLHEENTVVQQQNAELRMTAMVDGLTGLKNRRAYDEEATKEWQRSKRLKRPFIMAIADIDHFKKVNDTHGHAIGDVALMEVAKALQVNGRDYDMAYRFGGEEFVLVLPECSPDDCLNVIERIRVAIEDLEIKVPNDVLKITASFGVAVYMHQSDDADGMTLERLLESADQLLYQAKREGRNRVRTNLDRPAVPAPTFPTDSQSITGSNSPASN